MQEQNLNVNTARLDDLVNTISEARRSLQNWQDKRTEALIRLDAFAYDVQKIEEERARTEQRIAEMRQEAHSQAKIYQSHVSELTDQLQLLKLENENLRNEILDKNLGIESLHKEIDSQKVLRGQLVQQHNTKLNEQRAEIEVKFSNQIWDLKMKNEGVAAQLLDATERCAEAETKVEKLERELLQIRSHMMGILQSNGVEYAEKNVSKNASGPNNNSSPAQKTELETHNIQAVTESASNAKSEDAPSVEDYLKRLGY